MNSPVPVPFTDLTHANRARAKSEELSNYVGHLKLFQVDPLIDDWGKSKKTHGILIADIAHHGSDQGEVFGNFPLFHVVPK